MARPGQRKMAGEGEASAASLGGAAYHVGIRPVVLDKIHVHGSEVMERMTKVPAKGHGLQEDLRQQHGGAEIDVDASLKVGYE